MLIAESIFLLLTPPDGKQSRAMASGGLSVRAGLLGDLLLMNLAEFSQDKNPRVTLKQGVDLEAQSPLIRSALDVIADKNGARITTILGCRAFPSAKEVAQHLVTRGVLRSEDASVLGIPRTRYVESDSTPESRLRRHLVAVVEDRQQPTNEDALILGILNGINQLSFVFKKDVNLTGNQLRRRVKEIFQQVSDDSVLGEAVQKIVRSVGIAVAAGAVSGGVMASWMG